MAIQYFTNEWVTNEIITITIYCCFIIKITSISILKQLHKMDHYTHWSSFNFLNWVRIRDVGSFEIATIINYSAYFIIILIPIL